MGRTMNALVQRTFKTFFGMMTETWNAIPDNEKYTMMGVFAVLLILGFKFRYAFTVIRWSVILSILSIVAPKAYTLLKDNKKAEDAFDKDLAQRGK